MPILQWAQSKVPELYKKNDALYRKNVMKEQKQNKYLNNKVFIQCGWETECKKKDCLNCPRKHKYILNLTLAEEIAIEDFAVCDLNAMINGGEYSKGYKFPGKPEEVELMQDVIRKTMKKIFRQQK